MAGISRHSFCSAQFKFLATMSDNSQLHRPSSPHDSTLGRSTEASRKNSVTNETPSRKDSDHQGTGATPAGPDLVPLSVDHAFFRTRIQGKLRILVTGVWIHES